MILVARDLNLTFSVMTQQDKTLLESSFLKIQNISQESF